MRTRRMSSSVHGLEYAAYCRCMLHVALQAVLRAVWRELHCLWCIQHNRQFATNACDTTQHSVPYSLPNIECDIQRDMQRNQACNTGRNTGIGLDADIAKKLAAKHLNHEP